MKADELILGQIEASDGTRNAMENIQWGQSSIHAVIRKAL
jgi:hypothetical protein